MGRETDVSKQGNNYFLPKVNIDKAWRDYSLHIYKMTGLGDLHSIKLQNYPCLGGVQSHKTLSEGQMNRIVTKIQK